MKLQGKKVVLKTLTEEHLPVCFKWVHDPEVMKYMLMDQVPKTIEGERKWFRKFAKNPANKVFAIETENGQYIGNISLNDIEKAHRRSMIGGLIGEKEYWDKGYGTDAFQTILKYGFQKLKLHKILLTVDPQNKRGIGCYKKCGFKKEGYLKDQDFVRGRWRDSILMAIFNPYERSLHHHLRHK